MASIFGAATDTQTPFSGVVPTQRGYNLQYLDSPGGGRQFYLPSQQTQAAYGFYNLPGDVWGQGTPYDFSVPSREVIDPSAQYPQYRMGTRAVTGGRLFNENPLAGEQDYYQPVAGEGGSFWKQIAPLAMFALAPLAGWAIGGALAAGGAGAAGAGAGGAGAVTAADFGVAAGGAQLGAAGAGVGGAAGSSALLGSAGAGELGADAALAGSIDFGGLAAGVSPTVTYGAGGGALTAAEYASLSNQLGAAGGLGGAAGDIDFAGVGGPAASQGFSFSGLLNAMAGGGGESGIGAIGGGPFSKILGAGSGIYGLLQSIQMEELARKSMNKAPYQFDPFGMGPRAPYANQLSALMADPRLLEKYPGYQAGLQAVTRNMASQGYLGSGNMMAALSNYGGEAFNRETSRLAQLAGANFAPSAVPYDTSGLAGMAAGANLGSRALGTLGYVARSQGY